MLDRATPAGMMLKLMSIGARRTSGASAASGSSGAIYPFAELPNG